MTNEPILEALNFALDTDLIVNEVRAPQPSTSGTSGQGSSHHLYNRNSTTLKNSKAILPSAVLLGEDIKTPCPLAGCPLIFDPLALRSNKDAFLGHLLEEHKLVIDEVDKIANLHKYILYWKDKLASAPLSRFCVAFLMAGPTAPAPPKRKRPAAAPAIPAEAQIVDVDKSIPIPKEAYEDDKLFYYMLMPMLEEDEEIRKKLWNSRLETILEVNRQEREQTDFSRPCFFCRETFTGNRAQLFEHMKVDHSFRIGKPDNIVFVEEFLELIGNKLKELICLNCEKVFKDKTILRDHMRKKGHKRLNPNNPEYNRYYTINYLEPGKDWRVLEAEEPVDERTEEDWTEANEEKPNIVCLLCSEQSPNFDNMLDHMKFHHGFDFAKISSELDFYQKVKVVNFVRRTVFLNTCLYCELKFVERTSLVRHVSEHSRKNDEFPSGKVWNQPEYFFPTYENDQFLVLLDKDNEAEDDDLGSTISSEEERLVIPEDMPKLTSTGVSREDLECNMDSPVSHSP